MPKYYCLRALYYRSGVYPPPAPPPPHSQNLCYAIVTVTLLQDIYGTSVDAPSSLNSSQESSVSLLDAYSAIMDDDYHNDHTEGNLLLLLVHSFTRVIRFYPI